MASLDSLPADQRAVLQLVLQQGHTYDDIARLLSIDRAAVRDRALGAFDALGPQTRVPAERRALITDYLLGQLPSRVSEQTRDRLAESAGERAWARVLGSELAPLAKEPLPEIPVESARRGSEPAQDTAAAAAPTSGAQRAPVGAGAASTPASGGGPGESGGSADGPRNPDGTLRASSRRGGALLLGLGVLVVVIVIVIIASSGGGSKKPSATASTASTPATTPTTATTGTTTTPGAKLIAQVNLTSPTGAKTTAGVAQVIKEGANQGLVIVAQGIAANTAHDAYAVWLYNSPSDSKILGFVNPGVKSNGKLQTAGVLPATASHFKQLLVTLETTAKPKAPGKIVLQGALNLQ